MMPTRHGSLRLFRVRGIDVFLHWSWFLVALLELQLRAHRYDSFVWNVLEYLALFGIVLLHEFGHALACRQVGGQADQIVLWPLGGVAYVAPPQRPGAMLWSIAAGPLVNVALFPILTGFLWFSRAAGWMGTAPDAYLFVWTVWLINLLLLIFNLLPIYPLDGGQILRSLLWYRLGRARSLLVASTIGFFGVGAVALLALWMTSFWLGIIAVFILANCWRGLTYARALVRLDSAPRREEFACPNCRASPPVGRFWGCGKCRKAFDLFEHSGMCHNCETRYGTATCAECGKTATLEKWGVATLASPIL